MIPYFIFLVIVIVIAFHAYKNTEPSTILVILLFIVMVVFAGVRSASVGTDTNAYARSFEELNYLNKEIGDGLDFLTDEPAYYFLQKLLGQLSNEYYVLLTGVAVIFVLFVIFSIGKYSEMPVLSLFVFIALGYYTFVFNAARQGIAMAVYMLSIPYLFNRQFGKYMIVVLCAALFHKSIVIAIPLYFFFTMRYSIRSLIIVLLGGIAIGFYLPAFLDYGATLESRYALYTEGSAVGGHMLTLFYTVLAFFFTIQRKYIKEEDLIHYDVYLHMLLVGSAIYLIVSLTGSYVELTRFAAYFQLASIFLWPMLIKDRVIPLSKIVYAAVIVGHIGYYYIFLTQMGNLVPYTLNPNLFDVIL